MIHLIFEALLIGAILIAIRNIVALPIACILHFLRVEDARYKARAVVGRLGTLASIAFALLVVAVAWKSDALSAIGVALTEITTNSARATWLFVSGAWCYLWS